MTIKAFSKQYIRFTFCILLSFISFHTSQLIAQCVQSGADVWTESWESCQKTPNPNPSRSNSHWILFEFPTAESITESHIWNANKTGQSNKGGKNISIDYSIDGINWLSKGNITLAKGTESANYAGSAGPDFGGLFIKKILFTINSTHGNTNCASLSEVKFTIDENACYGTIDVCGICNGKGKISWFKDQDRDGLGNPNNELLSCTQPFGYVLNQDDPCDDVPYGWDIIGSMFKSHGCTGCHGSGGASGLDLRSYDTAILGGAKCGPAITAGTNLVGIITIPGYSGCGQAISGNTMNQNIEDPLDSEELAMIQKWIDGGALENCDCQPSDPDTDGDGVCDDLDNCPNFDNSLIGSSCNDGNDCTINDTYRLDCNCAGIPAIDTDNDGVCDSQDALPLNPCSADGTIDGIESFPWIGSGSNDCDNDGIILAQGDFDDFSACIDNYGYVPSVECACGPTSQTAGGFYGRFYGTIGGAFRGGGMPDGIITGFIGYQDTLTLTFPSMQKGDEICITLGFHSVNGLAVIELNGIGSYRFPNDADIIEYGLQEFCFKTINDGPQEIFIMEDGESGIKLDGSTYQYCPCTPSDPLYNSPECQCANNIEQTISEFDSHVNVGGTPANGAGFPDGVFSGNVSGGGDTLILSFPNIQSYAEICVTVGFNDPASVILIEQSEQYYSFQNATGQSNLEAQEFCFPAPASIKNNTLILTDNGAGSFVVDGAYLKTCVPCSPADQDSDSDGICDANDTCPLSQFGDSDGDGICDNADICQGFDDNHDSDNDGNPNGCDTCYGYNDNIDSDGDGVPNGCDACPGQDDALDDDKDGIPNACDLFPCLNFITETNNELIKINQAAHIQVNTNGYVENNSNFTYSGGISVHLDKGFEVLQGGTFHAIIGPCGNAAND